MNIRRFIYFFYTCFFLSLLSMAQVRTVTELKNDWKFHKGKSEGAFLKDFDDSDWETVTIPHDWAVYGPFNEEIDRQTVAIPQNNETVPAERTGRTGALPFIGEGWYRNEFVLPPYDEGKKV